MAPKHRMTISRNVLTVCFNITITTPGMVRRHVFYLKMNVLETGLNFLSGPSSGVTCKDVDSKWNLDVFAWLTIRTEE
jgi:hypothetical protein